MANLKKIPGVKLAQLSDNPLDRPPYDLTPEEALGFSEPGVTGDEINVIGASPRNIPIPSEPARFDISPPVQPNGMPTALVENAKSPQDKLLEYISSPEYKARQKQLYDLGNQAIDEQRKGIQSNESDLQRLQNQSPQLNVAPALSLVDAWTGSKFAQNYNQPETPEQRQLKLMAIKDQLQKQRQGLTKEQIDLIKNQMSGVMDPLKLAKETAQMEYYNRYAAGGPVQQLQTQRQDFADYQKVLDKIDNDKINTQRLANYSNLSNALTNFTNATIRTPNQLAELEQTIRNSLGTKGTGGVDERDQTYLRTFERRLIEARQYMTSHPTDVKGIQSTINHLKELAGNEQDNFRQQVKTRWSALTAGHEPMFERNPHYREAVESKIQAAAQQFNPPQIKEKPRDKSGKVIKPSPAAAVTPGAPAPDANLDQMSAEELQKWIDAHGN